MSVACSCRRQNYSQWRLAVLQELFATTPLSLTRPRLPFLHIQTRGSSKRWASNQSSKPTGSTEDATSADDTRQTQDADSTEPNSWLFASTDQPDGTPARRRPPTETTDDVLTRIRAASKFDPHSEEGREKLKSALETLQNLYKDLNQKISMRFIETSVTNADEDESPAREEIKDTWVKYLTPRPENIRGPRHRDPPESPLMAHVRDRRERLSQTKLSLHPGQMEPLHDNVWAQMLASPIRQCGVSFVRAPRHLLTFWNFVENEEDDSTYILPSSLADNSSIWRLGAEKGHTGLHRDRLPSQQAEDQQDKKPDHTEDATEVEQFKPAGVPATVPILPHMNLLRHATVQMTKQDPRRSMLLPMRGSAQKIIPLHVKLNTFQLMHFERHRANVKKKTGLPSTVELPKGALNSLDDLSWDPYVAGRLIRILRSRVMAALISALQLNANRSADEGLQRIDILPAQLNDPSLWAAPPSQAPPAEPVLDHKEMPKSAPDGTYGNKQNPLEAAFFLHVAPYPHPTTKDRLNRSPASATDPFTCQYLPPSLAIGPEVPKRAPIFPLLPLLGTYHTSTLRTQLASLLANTSTNPRAQWSSTTRNANINLHLPSPDTTKPIPNATAAQVLAHIQSNQPFTLLFRNATRYRMVLETEIWRLWRYVGGRDALEWWEQGVDVGNAWVWGDPRLLEAKQGDHGGGEMGEGKGEEVKDGDGGSSKTTRRKGRRK